MIVSKYCTILQSLDRNAEYPLNMANVNQVGSSEHENLRVDLNREELIERIARATPKEGTTQVLPGVSFNRAVKPTPPRYGVSEPAFGVIAQGSKEVLLGDTRYRYDPAHYLIATVELPTISHVVEASPQHPYLSLSIQLDPIMVGSVLIEAGHIIPRHPTPAAAIAVSPLDANLLDAAVRLPTSRHTRRSACSCAYGDAGDHLSAVAQ